MIRTSTNQKSAKLLIAMSALLCCTSLYGQEIVSVPGIVSNLTINQDGNIECIIHQEDQVAADHHANFISNMRSMPQAMEKRSSAANKKNSGGAQIVVDYFLSDPDFLPQVFDAIDAFQSAVDIWAMNIHSDQVIRVAAIFNILPPGVLGSAGPRFIFANVPGMERDTWYGNALADKLAGEDLVGDNLPYDIVAQFSTVFPNWYFGVDGNTPATDFDFRTVVLHELGHGLGFFGSMFADNNTGIGSWGFGIPDPIYPAIYDRLAHDQNGKQLIKENKFLNFSQELGDVLFDDPLLFRGPNIVGATNGKGARIFTTLDIPGFTGIWLPGSSYSHLDFFTYAGEPDGLMVPFLFRGLAFDHPGEITLAIFDDMGWNGKVNKPVKRDNLVVAENTVFPISLYPNPVQAAFVVNLGDFSGQLTTAQAVDALGRVHDMKYILSKQGQVAIFDTSKAEFNNGLYVLRLNFMDGQNETLRFIKN